MSPQAILALVICVFLAFPAHAAEAVSRNTFKGLKILVLSGAGAINSIPSRTSTTPVVEVRDENDRPIERADVVFEAPATGAGATFSKDRPILEVKTNAEGQAAAAEYRPNEIAGAFVISVKVSAGERAGSVEIHQSNSLRAAPPPKAAKSGISKTWIVLGIAAGAAYAWIVVGRRSRHSSRDLRHSRSHRHWSAVMKISEPGDRL
jgi:hypothetical protein